MALSFPEAVQNAINDAIVDRVDLGSSNAQGTLRIREAEGGTLLCSIDLSNPAFGASASGVATLAGTPLSGTAVASGTATWFDVVDCDETIVYSGTVTATGGGGDAIIDNAGISTGDEVQLLSHTITAP